MRIAALGSMGGLGATAVERQVQLPARVRRPVPARFRRRDQLVRPSFRGTESFPRALLEVHAAEHRAMRRQGISGFTEMTNPQRLGGIAIVAVTGFIFYKVAF